MRKRGRSEITISGYESHIPRHLGNWLMTPLRHITRTMVRRRHDEITKKAGPYGANGVIRAFRAVWNGARHGDEHLGECPTAVLDWNEERRREAALLPEELAEWHARVQQIRNPVIRDYYLFLLFTGLRRRSAPDMRWVDVDFLSRTLLIPKPKGDMKRASTLPISSYFVGLLERRRGGCL